jgi:hypothetical protein
MHSSLTSCSGLQTAHVGRFAALLDRQLVSIAPLTCYISVPARATSLPWQSPKDTMAAGGGGGSLDRDEHVRAIGNISATFKPSKATRRELVCMDSSIWLG